MAIKKRDTKIMDKKAKELADEIADKPYGYIDNLKDEEMTTTSFSLPKSVLYKLEDIAKDNKRAGLEPKNVSALIRKAIIEKLIIN